MARLPLLLTAAAAAVAAAVTPAIAGLTGNPSFSEKLPVNVPSRANAPSFPSRPAILPTDIPTAPAASSTDRREPEPGDDSHRGSGHDGGRDG